MNSKVLLMILDGWGIAEDPSVSAIDAARTPFYDRIRAQYPHIRLRASEEWVGLPKGQMGNSEVGHINIGAGRVVFQELDRISRALENGEILRSDVFIELLTYCKKNQKPLHLMGLVSNGGVHSHIRHLKSIISMVAKEGLKDVFIHAFTDGRDTDPESGLGFIQELEAHLRKENCGSIASVCGRYYAMDRDKRWGRIRNAYDLLTKGIGESFHSAEEAIRASYQKDISDEFIKPCVILRNEKPMATLNEGDAVLFFNFRTDRARELTQVLTQTANHEFNLSPLPLHFVCMAKYDETFQHVSILFEKDEVKNGLGETLAVNGLKQIRIAETEKYPHVTFFFNGGREEPYPGEQRILCPSPKVATYDLKPEMSAADIRDAILPELNRQSADFICLNFANPDMVGHTGIFEAAVKAIETVDACAAQVAETALANGYTVLITADHGNADKMKNPDGSPNTAHTTAPVPFILMQKDEKFRLKDTEGKLGDIAPTVLRIMGLKIPAEMTGDVLAQEIQVVAR